MEASKTHTVESLPTNTFTGVMFRVTRLSDGVVAVFSQWSEAVIWIEHGEDVR
jgi:hypothetical protein